MKRILLLALVSLFVSINFVSAQEVSKDSIALLKQEKKTLEVSKRLNDNKIKLAALQNNLQSKIDKKDGATKSAQDAAANNQEMAQKLANDSQDKSYAKRAKREARQAKRAAKSARKASNDLDETNAKIESLQKKIADHERTLASGS